MEYKTCPECGEKVPARRNFCDACNASLDAEKPKAKPRKKKEEKPKEEEMYSK